MHSSKSRFFFLVLVATGFAIAQDPPSMPIPDNLNAILQQNGFMAAEPRPLALAKTESFISSIKFVVRVTSNAGSDLGDAVYDGGRFVGSTVTDGGQYLLDGTSMIVNSVADGVQYSSSAFAQGVDYVIVKTSDATTWTVDTGLNGVKIIVRQAGSVVSWSIEKAVPDRIALNGVTFVRLDPVKNVVKAGISFSVKASSKTVDGLAATTDYILSTTSGLAVGTTDLVSGTLNLSMDVMTFAVNNTAGIASALVDLDANEAVSRAWGAIYAATTNILNWGDLGICGSVVGWKNVAATNLLVTDYWPPDEQITNLLSFDAEQCRLFGLARLYKGCVIHDACYSVYGKTKKECDDEVLENWRDACSQAYGGSHGWCYETCAANVSFFHTMLATAPAAPFTKAQNDVAGNQTLINQKITAYNDAKTKYNSVSTLYPTISPPQPASYAPHKFITLSTALLKPIVSTVVVPLLLQ